VIPKTNHVEIFKFGCGWVNGWPVSWLVSWLIGWVAEYLLLLVLTKVNNEKNLKN
jgi:hypothetical protein